MSAPCKDCKQRYPACHDKCKSYQDWVSIERQKKEDSQKRSMSEVDIMHINNIYKTKRRNNHV